MVSTLAGGNTFGAINGPDSTATFSSPMGLTFDQSGNVYLADLGNRLIRKINTNGFVSTFAGNGSSTSSNGIGTSASFAHPVGMVPDLLGNIYVADYYFIRKISPNGTVSTFAGSGDNSNLDGTGLSASFSGALGLAIDSLGNIYVADTNTIRRITPGGVVTTVAGNPYVVIYDGGLGSDTTFSSPYGLTVDKAGNIYVADFGNSVIRKITPAGIVSIFAGNSNIGFQDGQGTAASFDHPTGIAIDGAGNLYVSDLGNKKVRKITPGGLVSTFAGTGSSGSADGMLSSATFTGLTGIAIDKRGNIFLTDFFKVREIKGE